MKRKHVIWSVFIALVVIVGIFLAMPSKVPQDVEQATITQGSGSASAPVNLEDAEELPIKVQSSNFEFEGFALDGKKSHDGTFNVFSGSLFRENGVIVGMSGSIQADSVDTGIGGLDSHLMNDDFFDVEKFPTIEFTSASIEDNTMTGDLTFHGVTNSVSFPITRTAETISADFLLDTTPFGMKHTGTDKEVKIGFTFVA